MRNTQVLSQELRVRMDLSFYQSDNTEEFFMRNTQVLSQELPPQDPDHWSHRVMGDQNFRTTQGPLAWWYVHTAPPDPLPGASFEQRDLVRRGRIASAMMLFLAG